MIFSFYKAMLVPKYLSEILYMTFLYYSRIEKMKKKGKSISDPHALEFNTLRGQGGPHGPLA